MSNKFVPNMRSPLHLLLFVAAALLGQTAPRAAIAVTLDEAALDKVEFYDSRNTYTDGVVLSTVKALDSNPQNVTPQNFDDCKKKCAKDTKCNSFVWNTIDKACEMKSGTNLVNSFVDYFQSGVKAPFGSGAPTNQFDVRNYSYSDGKVLKSTPMPNVDVMDYGPCRDACAADTACNSFVWNNIDKVCESKSGRKFVSSVDYFFSGIKRRTVPPANMWIFYQCDVMPTANNAKCRYELAVDIGYIPLVKNITLNTGDGKLWELGLNTNFLMSQKALADGANAKTLTMAWDLSVPPRRIKEVWAEVTLLIPDVDKVTMGVADPLLSFTVPMKYGLSYVYPKPTAEDLKLATPACKSNISWSNTASDATSIIQHLDIKKSQDLDRDRNMLNFYWHMFVNMADGVGGYTGLQQSSDHVNRIVFSVWGTKQFAAIASGVKCAASDQQEGTTQGVSCLLDGSFGSAIGPHTLQMSQVYNDTDKKVWVTGNVDGKDVARVAVAPKPNETTLKFHHEYSANEYFGSPPTAQTVATWEPPTGSTDSRSKTALYRYDCDNHD
jgi:hypothetical protein